MAPIALLSSANTATMMLIITKGFAPPATGVSGLPPKPRYSFRIFSFISGDKSDCIGVKGDYMSRMPLARCALPILHLRKQAAASISTVQKAHMDERW